MSSRDYHCCNCKGPLDDNNRCSKCKCEKCGEYAPEGFCHWCEVARKRELNSIINSLKSFSEHLPQPQPSSLYLQNCLICRDPLGDNSLCDRCFCNECGLSRGFCICYSSKAENSFAYDSNPNSFNEQPNLD